MSEASPSRTPVRRRLTIAALVLLVLGGGLWWSTRPKIDPRLVGMWKIAKGDFTTASFQCEFLLDGTIQPDIQINNIGFEWSVSGNRLYVETYNVRKPRTNLTMRQLAAMWWYAKSRLNGSRVVGVDSLEELLHNEAFDVIRLDESRIELRRREKAVLDENRHIVLERVER